MAKKEQIEEMEKMKSVCQFLRDEMIEGFKDLKKLKESGRVTDADLDYELAKDRKAGIALKSIIVEINVEKIGQRQMNQIEE